MGEPPSVSTRFALGTSGHALWQGEGAAGFAHRADFAEFTGDQFGCSQRKRALSPERYDFGLVGAEGSGAS